MTIADHLRSIAGGVPWNTADKLPPEAGWYQVKLGDGSVDWRAWGRGAWWRQVEGGWIAWYSGDGAPMDFQWRGPVKDIALNYSDLPKA